jgi:hypothetical protein
MEESPNIYFIERRVSAFNLSAEVPVQGTKVNRRLYVLIIFFDRPRRQKVNLFSNKGINKTGWFRTWQNKHYLGKPFFSCSILIKGERDD